MLIHCDQWEQHENKYIYRWCEQFWNCTIGLRVSATREEEEKKKEVDIWKKPFVSDHLAVFFYFVVVLHVDIHKKPVCLTLEIAKFGHNSIAEFIICNDVLNHLLDYAV